MTSTLIEYSAYAETALAAYASGATTSNENERLGFYRAEGMSVRQAQAFNETWTVLSQSPDTPDGFSATLFQHRTSGEKVLAIRGTDFDHTGLANATHLRLRLTPCEA